MLLFLFICFVVLSCLFSSLAPAPSKRSFVEKIRFCVSSFFFSFPCSYNMATIPSVWYTVVRFLYFEECGCHERLCPEREEHNGDPGDILCKVAPQRRSRSDFPTYAVSFSEMPPKILGREKEKKLAFSVGLYLT